MLGISRAYDAHPPAGGVDAPVVYSIANGTLRTAPQATADGIVDVGIRRLALYTESLQLFNLREAAHVALCHNPPFGFKYLTEPEDLDEEAATKRGIRRFRPAANGASLCVGEKMGANAASWRGLAAARR